MAEPDEGTNEFVARLEKAEAKIEALEAKSSAWDKAVKLAEKLARMWSVKE